MNIRNFVAPIAVALLTIATTAHATTVNITGPLSTGSYTNTVDGGRLGLLANDNYKFTVSGPETLSSWVSTTGLTGASEKLFESSNGTDGWTELAGGFLGAGSISASVNAGEYYKFVVGAIGAGRNTSYTFSVSAVPLPGSLLLFGTGLVGLVGVGARKARRSKTV